MGGAITGEIVEDLEIDVEYRSHASTNNLWIEVVDGRRNDADVLNIEGCRSAHDGAKIAGVGRINKE